MAAPLSRITPLHTGHYTMPADGPRYPGERILVTAFLIEHPRGRFLFDTGFSAAHQSAVETFGPIDIRPIDEVLAAVGVRPRDVALVANCHFHSDHSGGNYRFPGTPIVVQRAELEHARATDDYTHLPSVADFAGAVLEPISGDAEPWPGIRIVATPGHSPGHQSVVVETRAGRVILAGQAFNFASDYGRERYSLEIARRGEAHAPYRDWVAAWQDLDPWRIYFAHDRATWQRGALDPVG